MTSIADLLLKCDDHHRVFIFPDSRMLYINSFGNEDFLYCGKDGVCVPFPDELGLYHFDKNVSEPLCGMLYKSGLYTWNAYGLTWKGIRFLKIAPQSKHVVYEVAKI